MELNVLFSHSITTKNGDVECVVCAEFNGHLYTIIKLYEGVVSLDKPMTYRYCVDGFYASSNKNIDIIEALKAALRLPNTCTDIDPDFYFDHD